MKRQEFVKVGLISIGLATGVAGCGHDFEPPDRAVRVLEADSAYSAALFDTVSWSDPGIRTEAGNTVYAERCRRCHGEVGRGDTDYARERGIVVPSLVEPGGNLEDLDTIRRTVFRGHERAMPIYGDGLLSAREIDAVAAYILLTLRPEVLERG